MITSKRVATSRDRPTDTQPVEKPLKPTNQDLHSFTHRIEPPECDPKTLSPLTFDWPSYVSFGEDHDVAAVRATITGTGTDGSFDYNLPFTTEILRVSELPKSDHLIRCHNRTNPASGEREPLPRRVWYELRNATGVTPWSCIQTQGNYGRRFRAEC